MMQKNFQISTDSFTGPFDLLLSLIEERKLLVNEVSLSEVADRYIEYVNSHENFPIDETADFIVVAATLIYIKSKSLLPDIAKTTEDEEDAIDLQKRLSLYKVVREGAHILKDIFGNKISFERPATEPVNIKFSPGSDLSLEKISETARDVAHSAVKPVQKLREEKVSKVISLEEAMNNMKNRISKSLSETFKNSVRVNREEKVLMIVNFLALLELMKNGIINAKQNYQFANIDISSRQNNTPSYG